MIIASLQYFKSIKLSCQTVFKTTQNVYVIKSSRNIFRDARINSSTFDTKVSKRHAKKYYCLFIREHNPST